MDLYTFLLLPANAPFAIALGLMIGIALIEIVSMLMGLGISELIDQVFSVDIDVDVDVDLDVDADGFDGFIDMEHGIASSIFNWLHLGKVPVLILFCAFLGSFGLIGYFGQSLAMSLLGIPLSGFLAGPLAFIGAVPVTRTVGKWFGKILPKEETSAIRIEELLGKVGKITIGTAEYDRTAEAKVTDRYGTTHYIRVSPLNQGEEIPSGTEVLLVEKDGNTFRVTAK